MCLNSLSDTFRQECLSFFVVLTYNGCMDFDVSHILIRKNRRARHLRLQIDKNGHPVLTVPFLCPQWYALKWAEKQQGWIQKHIFRPAVFVPDQNI